MRVARFCLKALVSFGSLGLLFVVLPWNEVREAAGSVSLAVWTALLGGFVAGHALAIFKWRLVVNALDAGLSPSAATRCYAAGLFANLALPGIVGGDVLRAVLASRAGDENARAAVLGGVADRLIDVFSLVSLAGGASLLLGPDLTERGHLLVLGGAFGVLSAGAVVVFLALRRPVRRWPSRVRRPIARALVALRRVRRDRRRAALAVLLSLGIQTLFVLLNAWLAASMGIRVPLVVWFFAWPLAKLAGVLPISLGGLGVRDGTLAAILVPFGVLAAQGLVVSLVWQSVLIAGGLLGGVVWSLCRAPR